MAVGKSQNAKGMSLRFYKAKPMMTSTKITKFCVLNVHCPSQAHVCKFMALSE